MFNFTSKQYFLKLTILPCDIYKYKKLNAIIWPIFGVPFLIMNIFWFDSITAIISMVISLLLVPTIYLS
jgi:hypothetical protein